MSCCMSILRIGPFSEDYNGAQKLREAILQYLASPVSDDDTISFPTASTRGYQCSITNRYFSANVSLVAVDEETVITDTTTSFSEDGMILVFDAERSHPKYATSISCSFDAMESIHDRAVQRNMCGELLRLCVSIGNHRAVHYNGTTQPLTEKEYEEEYSRRILWCLDRGYEYIEVPDLTDTSQGHNVRDKDGFARIIEAIAGTVWTSAVMAAKQQQTLQQSFAETRTEINIPPPNVDANDNDADVANQSHYHHHHHHHHEYEPPSIAFDENDQERERQAQAALLADCVRDDTAAAAAAIDASPPITEPPSAAAEERHQERSLHAFEASLNEARRIRELSRSGQLSDDERRKRASDAAMLILQTMEQMGLDDDDDENDEDNSVIENELAT